MRAPDATVQTKAVEFSGMESRLLRLLRSTRLPCDTELALQDAIEQVLIAGGLPYRREVKIAGGRIDFLIGGGDRFGPREPGIGLEVKIKGGGRAIYRQCAAYCGDPRLGRLVVVSATALQLPEKMNGKTVAVISVGNAPLVRFEDGGAICR
jgi:hypothetical protein